MCPYIELLLAFLEEAMDKTKTSQAKDGVDREDPEEPKSPLLPLRKLVIFYSYFGIVAVSNPDGQGKFFKIN